MEIFSTNVEVSKSTYDQNIETFRNRQPKIAPHPVVNYNNLSIVLMVNVPTRGF